jgi:chromosome segregation ATPase
MSEKQWDLVQATVALDEELERVERLVQSAARVPLTSRRNLEKAARTTSEAAEAQAHAGERIRALMEALTAARVRNEATVEAMQARSQEIKKRSEELTVLIRRFEAIGEEARSISSLAQQVPGEGQAARLDELEARMGAIAESARTLWQEAEGGGWSDVAHDADALRQQVLAAKNKVALLSKKVPRPS